MSRASDADGLLGGPVRRPGQPASPASFDTWEQRYFDWLDTVLIPGAPAATVDAARAALVEALNAIANDAP